MKKLNLLVIKEFIGPLLLTFLIVIFLLIMQFLWRFIEDLAGKGLGLLVFSELMFYASASLVPLALPLAILLASLMTFGNFGENYELTAMKSAGISLIRIMKPLVAIITLISILAFFYSNYSLPYFNLKMRSLINDIQDQRPEIKIKEGIFFNGIDHYSIKIGNKNTQTGLLYNVIIYDHTPTNSGTLVTIADSGTMAITGDKSKMVITLYSGYSYVEMSRNNNTPNSTFPFRRDRFMKQTININLTGFDLQRTENSMLKNHFQMMNLKQLSNQIDTFVNEINIVKNEFKKTFLIQNYNKTNDKLTLFDTIPDSLRAVFNYHFIWDSIPNTEKQTYLSRARESMQNIKTNLYMEQEMRYSRIKRMHKHEIEYHKKFTLSVACLVFFFIGAPLGAIIRKGGLGLPLVISVLFFIFYYIISLTGEKMVRESIFSPFVGMWLASFILVPLGAFITYKATHEATLFTKDFYIRVFNNLFQNIRKRLVKLNIMKPIQ